MPPRITHRAFAGPQFGSEGWARRFFNNWRAGLKWQRLKPENKISLGFVDGLNTKIGVFLRRAYGLPEAVKRLSETELTELEAIRPHLPPGTIAYLASIAPEADSERDLSSSRVAAQSLPSAAHAEAERAMAS